MATSNNLPLNKMGLSARAYHCLFYRGITTAGELLALSPMELMRLPGMGIKTYNHILERLSALGYDTGKYPYRTTQMSYYRGIEA